jgi:hypothetical protein
MLADADAGNAAIKGRKVVVKSRRHCDEIVNLDGYLQREKTARQETQKIK